MSDDAPPPTPPEPQPLPRFVQRTIKPDGKVYLYFRKAGVRKRLHSALGTKELDAEIARLLKTVEAPPTAGTIGQAIKDYRASPEFTGKAKSTKIEYERWMGEIRDDLGDVGLAEIDPGFILDLRDAWAKRGHRAANVALQVLRNILKRPMIVGSVTGDPFARIDAVARPHDLPEPHPIWFQHEVDAVLAEKHEGLVRAVALGRYAAARRGDIVKIPESAVADQRVRWRSGKRNVQVDMPLRPELAAVLARTKRKAVTIAYNEDHNAWTVRGLEQALKRTLERLVRAKKVRSLPGPDGKQKPILTLHGLRHTFGVEMALHGATDAEIMATMGLKSIQTVQKYRRQADAIRLADSGMAKVISMTSAAGTGAKERTLNREVKTEVETG